MILKVSAIVQSKSDSFKRNSGRANSGSGFVPCLRYLHMLLQRETRPNLDKLKQIMIQIRIQNYFNCKYLD